MSIDLSKLFESIFGNTSSSIEPVDFIICLASALIIGLFISLLYRYNSRSSGGFVITIAIIPAIVTVIILIVSGSIGMGIAVAGAFSLVRFRSAPGKATEICAIFLSMGTGLLIGTGFIGYAVLFAVILGCLYVTYFRIDLMRHGTVEGMRLLIVTIPEDLNYEGFLDDLFGEMTFEHKLRKVKTTNMGSMFRLTYEIKMKDLSQSKQLID